MKNFKKVMELMRFGFLLGSFLLALSFPVLARPGNGNGGGHGPGGGDYGGGHGNGHGAAADAAVDAAVEGAIANMEISEPTTPSLDTTDPETGDPEAEDEDEDIAGGNTYGLENAVMKLTRNLEHVGSPAVETLEKVIAAKMAKIDARTPDPEPIIPDPSTDTGTTGDTGDTSTGDTPSTDDGTTDGAADDGIADPDPATADPLTAAATATDAFVDYSLMD